MYARPTNSCLLHQLSLTTAAVMLFFIPSQQSVSLNHLSFSYPLSSHHHHSCSSYHCHHHHHSRLLSSSSSSSSSLYITHSHWTTHRPCAPLDNYSNYSTINNIAGWLVCVATLLTILVCVATLLTLLTILRWCDKHVYRDTDTQTVNICCVDDFWFISGSI